MNEVFLGAYWAARKESIEECADRLANFFDSLSRCDAALVRWFKLGRSRKDALKTQVDVGNKQCLLQLLADGRNLDFYRRAMQDLGFGVFLWNGGPPGKEASLHVGCGANGQYVSNVVTLDFPENLGQLKKRERMSSILTAVAKAWEPDWCGVMSDKAMELRNFNAERPFADWMLYVSRKWLPEILLLEPPASAMRLDKLGTLIVVQDDLPDPLNAAQVRHIERVQDALDACVKIA